MLYMCQPRASHFNINAPRAASACLCTVSAPLFCCFRPSRNYAPGQACWNRDGIISDQESPFCRVAEGPPEPRANWRQESGISLRDIIATTGPGSSRPFIASAPGVRAWATPFCPFHAKTGGSRWDFCRDLYLQFEHTDGIWGSVQVYVFLTLLHWSEMTGDLSLMVVKDTVHELTLQSHQRATA